MSTSLRLACAFSCVSFSCTTAILHAAEAAAEDVQFFEQHIRPLLAKHCYECHSSQAKILQGGLSLESRAGWMQGGNLGQAIMPGKPDESRLIAAIRYDDSELQMPPEGKLPEAEISHLIEWVKRGAPDPRDGNVAKAEARTIDLEKGREFWAFQPPADPPIPQVNAETWPQSPLDLFVLSKLEEAGLSPAPPADKRTLIRRATFDLIGLPPTPQELQAFLADESPEAFARVVERLLASPHYGERWGRHWLDVARYADSNGLDENVAHGNAWRYRDYVVAALNADKPYDHFVREQLAGDLLGGGDLTAINERLVATGFLSLGPKVLAEVDEQKMEMDIVDEQISTVGRAFLGLTLGCARCHDHKFDPIRAEDYYAMAGVFKSTQTMESFTKIARWHENSIAAEADLVRQREHEAKLAAQKQELDAFVSAANQKLLSDREPDFKLPENPTALYPKATQDKLKSLREDLANLEQNPPATPTAMGSSKGRAADVAVHIRGNHLTLGEKVPRGWPLVLCSDDSSPAFDIAQDSSGRLELARWLTSADHPLVSRVMVNRIWRWHFGTGIVRTPDNFGFAGERPDNQPLLDWLALRFIDHGWSIKAMHRLIMLSSTYQMSSGRDARAAGVDRENRLHWRADVRRLEADVIRDALLAVSGQLDRTMGGNLLPIKNREFVFNHTSEDATQYDSPRRSLYLPVIRNHLYNVFQLFDFPDPAVSSSDRTSTTIAPQALFMMNSELVASAAEQLANDLLAARNSNGRERIGRLYETAYGRPPVAREFETAAAFLARFEAAVHEPGESARPQAWQALCHAVLASNEFIYVK